MRYKRSDSLLRIRLLSFGAALAAGVVIFRLFGLQVLGAEMFREQAGQQYVAPPTADIFERGSIFFTKRDGTLLSAATTASGFKVAVVPAEIADPEEAFAALSAILPIERADFLAKASKTDDPYEEIAGRISKEDADRVRALALPGVRLYQEKWRFYPGGSLSAKTLGFLAFKGDELAGRYGLERVYEETLSRDENSPYVNFFAEVFSNIAETVWSAETRQGDIVTGIEPLVSQSLEGALADVMERFDARSAGGIIIDPADGSIRAMSHTPGFDLNRFSEVADPSVFANPLVENVFELGSVIKPLVVAAGLDTGAVTAKTTYRDEGFVMIEGKKISNFDGKGRGLVTVEDILAQSLNTGMVHIAERIGRDDLRAYLLSFGVAEKTGIDLPNEARGLAGNLDSPRRIEYANASFGQGIALSPVAAVRAFSALGNGGFLPSPHVAREILYENGGSDVLSHPPGPRVFSEATSEEITRMLVRNIDEAYFGGGKKMPRYSIAGKTGTAQIAKEDGTGYYEGKNMHSFFGYFPAYDPQFLIFLYVMEPKGVRFASETLIDPFMDLAAFLINYYDIPPDR